MQCSSPAKKLLLFPAGMSWGLRVYILTNTLFQTLYFEYQGRCDYDWFQLRMGVFVCIHAVTLGGRDYEQCV